MRNVTVNILLVVLAHARAEDSSDVLIDKLVDNLSNRVLKALSLHDTYLDQTALGKPGNLAISPRLNQMPFLTRPQRPPIAGLPGGSSLAGLPGGSSVPWAGYQMARLASKARAEAGSREGADSEPKSGGSAYPPPESGEWSAESLKKAVAPFAQLLNPGKGLDAETMEQVQLAATMMQSKDMQQRMEELKEDPELAGVFADMEQDVKNNGPAAMLKYYSNPKFLKKLRDSLGTVAEKAHQEAIVQKQVEDMIRADTKADDTLEGNAPPLTDEGKKSSFAETMEELVSGDKRLLGAAELGDAKATKEYLAEGCDPNVADPSGRTGLHLAAGAGYEKVVDLLIEAKANVDATDAGKNTPLHYAAGLGRVEVTGKLLDAGADANLENAKGNSAGEICRMNPGNEVEKDKQLMDRLEDGFSKRLGAFARRAEFDQPSTFRDVQP